MKNEDKERIIDNYADKLYRYECLYKAKESTMKWVVWLRIWSLILGSCAIGWFIDFSNMYGPKLLYFVFLFVILTFILTGLAYIYIPIINRIYLMKYSKEKNKYISKTKSDSLVSKMFHASKRLNENESAFWSKWWHPNCIKRSRFVKIAAAVGCVSVLYLKVIYVTQNNFTNMFYWGIVILLLVYCFLSITFYFSDCLIFWRRFPHKKCYEVKQFSDEIKEFWMDNFEKGKEYREKEHEKFVRKKKQDEKRKMEDEKVKSEIRRIHARMYNSEREQASSSDSYDDSGAYGYPADRGPSYRP